jgi:hypothetical protein
MSCHELRAMPNAVVVTRGLIGWDRPLQTFFVQMFSINEEGGESAHLWIGRHPHEIDTAVSAIAIVSGDCVIPQGLAATLEAERRATLGTFDADH